MSHDHRSLVAAAYHRAAAGFARTADRLIYRPLAEPLAAAVTAVIGPRPGLVLDAASGSGAFGRSFPRVVAIDIAAGQLAENAAAGRVRGDSEQLPFCDDAFAAAGCSFGINHLLDPGRAVREMARIAPVVGLSTWRRPERPYAPKRIVDAALERRCGRSRSRLGNAVDLLGDRVGSVTAVAGVLERAGLAAHAWTVDVELPWPGVDTYVEYRLAMPTTLAVIRPAEVAAVRAEVAAALDTLPLNALTWRPSIVIGVGTR